ncbi:MAG: hypothetical protein GEV04_18215 [Actinophytocola sp.]|nr:hypothetical protein [Actinophytocola sp.]
MTLDFGAKSRIEANLVSVLGDALGRDGEEDVSGVYLVDGKNKKKHLPVRYRDPTNPKAGLVCLCSRARLGVAGGQTGYLNATFAAPPEDVTSVDVHIPHVGTFKDVPIS